MKRRVLIYGAGEAGVMVLDEIKKHPDENIEVTGFIDDSREKIGTLIQGIEVFGGKQTLKTVIRGSGVNEVIIAMPSISRDGIKDIVRICKSEKIKLLIVPSTREIIEGIVRFDQIKNLDISDLLDREEVKIHSKSIRGYIEGESILVTGAAGSIGSALVKKLVNFNPYTIAACDMSENGLFYLFNALKNMPIKSSTRIIPIVGDIKDKSLIDELYCNLDPGVVFHAAAYKHVPLMQNHARMIFLNNVLGTRNLLELSLDYGVKRFIGISTDKAVYPVSVMGRTKRVCELLIGAYARKGLGASSVRFGNVLGSNGSVLTVFQEQINQGGPVTITSPLMERYFMTVDEAVSLVLQAGSIEGGGDVYVLDMGRPVKIRELAENLIILSGYTPGVDISIDYTGIREGEKITEDLFYREMEVVRSNYKGIFIEGGKIEEELILRIISDLTNQIYILPEKEILRMMDDIIDIPLKCSTHLLK